MIPSNQILSSLDPAQAAAIENLRARFAQLPDRRMQGRVIHRIDAVVMIALCSMLSDNDSFTDMEAFAKSQLEWLRTFLSLENGAPSHDVFRNVFMALRPQALLDILADWCGELGGRHIAIDGKSLRGSDSPASALKMMHVLRAWVDAVGISAGQEMCSEKSNEIEALPRLLDALNLKGAIVTIDAMGCQTGIARQIHRAGGDYILALKGNQKEAMEAVATQFAKLDALAEDKRENGTPCPALAAVAETVELSHGRFEQRVCTVISDLKWFDKSWKWEGLRSVVRIERTSHRVGTRDELSREIHYYLSSSLESGGKYYLKHVRGHWTVENKCHHVLDVTFGEDDCQVRERFAAHNLCIMREMAAKVLRDHPAKKSIRAKRKLAALDPLFRFSLIATIPSTPHA